MQNRPLKGIALKVLHVFLVTIMLALVKTIQGLPVLQVMFFRMAFAALPFMAWLALRGQLRAAYVTRRPWAHLTRSALSLTTMGLTFLAVQSLPLPEAVTLQYTQPLFVVALSALILREPVGRFRWGAVAVGFLGALIITWPRLTLLGQPGALSQAEVIGVLASLGAAATYAANVLVMGQLVRTDATTTVVLWLTTSGTLALGCALPFVWVTPSPVQLAQLALVGIVGGAVLLAISESLRAATAATSAPFEYASLIFAAVLGFALFDEVMDAFTLTGGALLIAAGLAILMRERRIARRRAGALVPDA